MSNQSLWLVEVEADIPEKNSPSLIVFTCQQRLRDFVLQESRNYRVTMLGMEKFTNPEWESKEVVKGRYLPVFTSSTVITTSNANFDEGYKVHLGYQNVKGHLMEAKRLGYSIKTATELIGYFNNIFYLGKKVYGLIGQDYDLSLLFAEVKI